MSARAAACFKNTIGTPIERLVSAAYMLGVMHNGLVCMQCRATFWAAGMKLGFSFKLMPKIAVFSFLSGLDYLQGRQ